MQNGLGKGFITTGNSNGVNKCGDLMKVMPQDFKINDTKSRRDEI